MSGKVTIKCGKKFVSLICRLITGGIFFAQVLFVICVLAYYYLNWDDPVVRSAIYSGLILLIVSFFAIKWFCELQEWSNGNR